MAHSGTTPIVPAAGDPDGPREAAAGDRRLLSLLRERGPSTAAEVASTLGIGAVATRTRLRSLEAGGWVVRAQERRGVGRPVARFSLTRRADALFPKRYDELAALLLEAIAEHWGPEGIERILQSWEDRLHAALDATLPEEPRARLEALAAHQSKNGFLASARADATGVALIERSCPVLAVAARHPEICRHEATLFGRTLRWKTALASCQATGDAVCVFRIGRAPATGGAARASAGLDAKE